MMMNRLVMRRPLVGSCIKDITRRQQLRLQSRRQQYEYRRTIKSLALSVYFKQPELGMKEYEILSRASAFLLAVDPPIPNEMDDSKYAHLTKNERDRQLKLFKQHHKYTPAGYPGDNRSLTELGWLEYAPKEVRPIVHVVCSSHVLAPYLWKEYYSQEWLNKVRQEHCVYSVEVFDTDELYPANNNTRSLGKFALNPYPIHHPEGRDVAIIHLQQEDTSLKIMQELGVEILYLKDLDDIYEKDDTVQFEGYVVAEPNTVDNENFTNDIVSQEEKTNNNSKGDATATNDDDRRIFYPYHETGQLKFHTRDRFFAKTTTPLPEGLCGGPVLDEKNKVCGIVEGIVSANHVNQELAGTAAFMPNYMMIPFIDYAERYMLQKILPKSLFQKAVTAKTTGHLGGGIFQKDPTTGKYQPAGHNVTYEEVFDKAIDQLKDNHSEEEVNAILNTIQRERREVLEILQKEGGDFDDIVEKVRQRTLQVREMIHEEYRNEIDKDEK